MLEINPSYCRSPKQLQGFDACSVCRTYKQLLLDRPRDFWSLDIKVLVFYILACDRSSGLFSFGESEHPSVLLGVNTQCPPLVMYGHSVCARSPPEQWCMWGGPAAWGNLVLLCSDHHYNRFFAPTFSFLHPVVGVLSYRAFNICLPVTQHQDTLYTETHTIQILI